MDSAYQQQLVEAALTGEQLRVRDGTYVRWAPGAGVELWLQVQDRDVVGIAPHFRGEAAMEVALTHRIDRSDESSLAGAFHAWANPSPESFEDGDFPFIFDLPDAARFAGLVLPRATLVQIAAFAHELQSWPDEAAFSSAQGDAQIKYATESFIPSGLFVNEGDSPAAYATFTGRVVRVESRANPFSGASFWWLRVRTLGGEVDVVADPSAVLGDLTPGGVVQGTFWLSGRLPSGLVDPSRPFWRRWMPV